MHQIVKVKLLLFASVWGIFTLVLELASPSKEFQVFSTCNSLYGEGGGLFTALTALLLSFLYSAVLLIRLLSPLKLHISPVLLFLLLGLLTHLVRAVGGLLLYQDIPAGICLTALTLFIQVINAFRGYDLFLDSFGQHLVFIDCEFSLLR